MIRLSARDVGSDGWDATTGFGALDLARGARAHAAAGRPAASPTRTSRSSTATPSAAARRRSGPARRRRQAVRDRSTTTRTPATSTGCAIPAGRRVRVTRHAALRRPRPRALLGRRAPRRARRRHRVVRSRRSGRRDGVRQRRATARRARVDGATCASSPRRGRRLDAAYTLTVTLARGPLGLGEVADALERSGVGTAGLSRRYHSASSAAWQPEPAAVTAWR